MERTITFYSKRRGFSLAEVLIVTAIVLILAGVSVPVFSYALRKYQLKRVQDQVFAAKSAAVAAYYTGYDSRGNKVDIFNKGFCTFLYDEANNAVYVVNYDCGVSGFMSDYSSSIEKYGLSISNENDYSNKVILITFDGRYLNTNPSQIKEPSNNNWINDYENTKGINESKGTVEEPIIKVFWAQADSSLFIGG